uniref:protein kinase family protein n=1 Tax=Mycobacterium sp. UM_Kg1 TaxID=1545691 RepID=UPI00061B277D
DVVRVGAGGLVVSEWVRGASLQEVAGTAPSPVGAGRAIRSLAGAAEAAHHNGVALSIDNPARVRVSIDGDVTLAFPATLPDTKPEDDIRGIGATLYALLVNRWPLADAGTGSEGGLQPADRDEHGNPIPPDAINPDIPFQIAAAASHAIAPDGGIRGASTLSNLLQQATALHEQTELLGPVADEPPRPAPAPPDDETRADRRRRVLIGLGIGGAVILVALLVLASVLNRIFGDVNGLDKTELGLSSPSASALPGAAGPSGVVKPIQATVFSPGGEADRPQDAGLAIDGDPATAWSTDTYSDPVPFPNFKNGVGLILQLPSPTVIGSVSLYVSSTGTRVELRSASTPKPSRLEDTTLLAPAKTLHPGSNKITADSATPTSNLLVWITTMGNTGGESRTQISEITVQAAS